MVIHTPVLVPCCNTAPITVLQRCSTLAHMDSEYSYPDVNAGNYVNANFIKNSEIPLNTWISTADEMKDVTQAGPDYSPKVEQGAELGEIVVPTSKLLHAIEDGCPAPRSAAVQGHPLKIGTMLWTLEAENRLKEKFREMVSSTGNNSPSWGKVSELLPVIYGKVPGDVLSKLAGVDDSPFCSVTVFKQCLEKLFNIYAAYFDTSNIGANACVSRVARVSTRVIRELGVPLSDAEWTTIRKSYLTRGLDRNFLSIPDLLVLCNRIAAERQ
eukprot:gene11388-476_t